MVGSCQGDLREPARTISAWKINFDANHITNPEFITEVQSIELEKDITGSDQITHEATQSNKCTEHKVDKEEHESWHIAHN